LNLKTLAVETNWEDVKKKYIEEVRDIKNNETSEKIRDVYEKLKTSDPTNNYDNTKIYFSVEKDELNDDEEYIDVHGKDGSKDESGNEITYGLDFCLIGDWVSFEIDENVLSNYDKETIVANCLSEIIFWGFTDEEKNKIIEDMRERIKKWKKGEGNNERLWENNLGQVLP